MNLSIKHRDLMKQIVEKRKARVRLMRSKGLTWEEIGKKIGVTRQRAQVLGRENG